MRDILEDLAAKAGGFVELRYHRKETRRFDVERGRVENAAIQQRAGVSVRVLEEGTWGFAATSDPAAAAVSKAIDTARSAARASAAYRRNKINALPQGQPARGRFEEPGYAELYEKALEAKIDVVLQAEREAREASSQVETARASYAEIFEEKAIVTSDGASADIRIVRPEFRVNAVANGVHRATYSEMIGVTGGWECVFQRSPAEMAEKASRSAVELAAADYAPGGRYKVILAPSIVGLLVHEAIGHTVEADFVLAGSAAAGRVGQRVGSEMVTLCDSGHSEHLPHAGGTIPVDDEGMLTQRTVIIREGILESYLHNRETAAHFGVSPTGNARAWEYADEPLIRMRNTYLEPGEKTLEELISEIDDGFLLDGPLNGQADANAEFMFVAARAQRIRHGKLAEVLRGAAVTGNAFDVLLSVDGISREFKWDMGSGYCGKGQPMKVDAGGPYVRCEVLIGGRS
ncbi:MAG: TldD/PmbA family protein [Candidatus Sericytochromatia bacterium]|nr:TldD/PmbA family protein [Candidatus Tanganyikabacteria bacterium]